MTNDYSEMTIAELGRYCLGGLHRDDTRRAGLVELVDRALKAEDQLATGTDDDEVEVDIDQLDPTRRPGEGDRRHICFKGKARRLIWLIDHMGWGR